MKHLSLFIVLALGFTARLWAQPVEGLKSVKRLWQNPTRDYRNNAAGRIRRLRSNADRLFTLTLRPTASVFICY